MSPEEKFQEAAAKVSAEIAKATAIIGPLWKRWEVYVIGAVCLLVGFIVGRAL